MGANICPGIINLNLCIHSLLERRDLWRREAEARQLSQPDPAMPPGHTRMPENQRLETLSNLLQSEYVGNLLQSEYVAWMRDALRTLHSCLILFLGPL